MDASTNVLLWDTGVSFDASNMGMREDLSRRAN